MSTSLPADAIALDGELLRGWPLPLDAADDKHARGTVLVVGGSPRTVGAVVLSGIAALRIGAGRLQLAVAEPASVPVGVAVPEALVECLPVHQDGRLRPRRAAELLASRAGRADAVLVGPGLVGDTATATFLRELVPCIGTETIVVLDAAAIGDVEEIAGSLRPLAGRLVLTANRQEVQVMLGRPRDADAPEIDDLRALARTHGAVVVSFGDVVSPDGRWWACRAGCPGLGTSGSGDVLAGLVAGAAARCAQPAQAACWATWAHAVSGRRLAAAVHEVGFIAREIADEVPATLHSLVDAASAHGAPVSAAPPGGASPGEATAADASTSVPAGTHPT